MSDRRLSEASQVGPGHPDLEGPCGICDLHGDVQAMARSEIHRQGDWVLRHHPHPAPMLGWLLLDTRRHLGGPIDFNPVEAATFGPMLKRCSALVQILTGCQRVYVIAFGEGARHLHAHLIPRHGADPSSEAWRVADLYRQVAAQGRSAASPAEVAQLVARARECTASWR
jgi:diadenosine tetraphosphate (Ap4A) HIT family hydrolase